ncbi:DedA family protein [Actinoplanes sp. NPDC051470]|uniref:DedA family protein n=1 Tax=Actinoplanes sp. NPDC051470 TaxID=3157224 RepID=UPI00342345CE
MPPHDELPGFLAGVAPLLDKYSYFAVAAVIGVESFGVPAPGQTIMVAAAIYAGAGRLNVFVVGIIAFVAAVLGDNIGYWIGVRGGRRLVHRWGKYVFITPARLERAEKFFVRRGNRIVVVARFIDGLRQLNGVIAGITAMPWRTFLLYNAIGAFLWVGWWVTVSYFLGTRLVEIIEHAHRYRWFAIPLVILAIGTYAFFHIRHIRRRRAREAAEQIEAAQIEAPQIEAADDEDAGVEPTASVSGPPA